MPGDTPWGQAQLRIFDRKFLPALKITKLVFFFSQVMKLFPEILIRVKLIYFSQFYRQYEKQRHTCRTQWNTCLMKTNDVASVVLFVNWLECFREIWAGLETTDLTSSSTRQLLQNNMGLTIYLEGGYVMFFRRRHFFFRRHRIHIFLFSGEVPI